MIVADVDQYRAYLAAQIEKTQRLANVRHPRVQNLVNCWAKVAPLGERILSVGCRNTFERLCLRTAGAKSVTCIDLVSTDPMITVMDMHALKFPDHTFDGIFASHSLEHAYDVDTVLSEFKRVSRRKAIWAIEVPIRFTPTEVDRKDFGDLERLSVWLSNYGVRILYGLELHGSPGVARFVGQCR